MHGHAHVHRVDLCVPRVGCQAHEGHVLVRYRPSYLPVGRSKLAEGGRSSSKLVWCEDDTGMLHAQLLQAGGPGTLDARRDALLAQFFEEFNHQLKAEAHARARGLRVRTHRVLPLAPSVGLHEWRSHTRGLGAYLAAEHADAYARGLDRLSLDACSAAMRTAHAASAVHAASGPNAAACPSLAFTPEVSPQTAERVVAAWSRVTAGLTPRLHRFLIQCSGSPDAWLARR